MELFLGKKSEEKNQDLRKPLDYSKTYDVVILGGGPSGMTAALYALRKKLDTALITQDIGGQLLSTWDLENYPGFKKIGGYELSKKFEEQATQFPLAFEEGISVQSIVKKDKVFEILLDNNKILFSRTVIAATGKKSRPLDVPGENEYIGKGVTYCATCDAPLFKNKKTVVAGGGNSGVEAALELSKIASKVWLVEILDHLIADEVLQEKLRQAPNVEILLQHKVLEIRGEQFVKEAVLKDLSSGKEKTLEIDGIFVEIGLIPNTQFQTSPEVGKNSFHEIVVDAACRTNIEGFFAAGDVTNVPEKQVVIAAGEGAKAALSAFKYLQHQ